MLHPSLLVPFINMVDSTSSLMRVGRGCAPTARVRRGPVFLSHPPAPRRQDAASPKQAARCASTGAHPAPTRTNLPEVESAPPTRM